ncbi:hypothetical protein [Microbispora sp. NBRC 16548]|uniref:hypothetical protein n=1 Tax=Microbispora sp. NBRC 16548 TaxID=3030994 RepID=UPI0024A2EA99|nr:hypothetical protein [Microbispora sp. NBRC 16548]GLX06692.1 hypothetical protein Misp03_36190 [Microbispora sp. NBRC 16548]
MDAVITVSIWHNTAFPDNLVSGWQSDHPMLKVYAYDIPAERARNPQEVLEEAFTTFNVGEDARAEKSRARGNRSLSVGDIVVVGEVGWACGSFGWEPLAGPINICKSSDPESRLHGSVPWPI